MHVYSPGEKHKFNHFISFVLFADSEHCRDLDEIGSSMCFSIQIPADIDHNDVESAELWVYKEPHVMDTNKHSFLIGEVETWDSKGMHNMHCIYKHRTHENFRVYLFVCIFGLVRFSA